MEDNRATLRPGAAPLQMRLRQANAPIGMAKPQAVQAVGKIIDWEAFHYGMLDHKFLNDPNPAKADHRRTIYELWVGELIDTVLEAEIAVYSKDGNMPKRLSAAIDQRRRDADILIGCMFESEKLLEHMYEFFNRHKELH